ncbi:MAG: aldehyde ferredoxin oxidoreductase family protein [Deltaproteobacteria bacterium]|nr:aldehyde ferredoxin oxidoreductase family protein [Deltaproteobacteria bacterium]
MNCTPDILEVDLTGGRWERIPYPVRAFREVLAGRGFNALFLNERLSQDTDPLGPDNLLVLSCGLLTGTAAPASSRVHLGALSPLTGVLGSSNVGGPLGRALHACGLQAVVIRGRSRMPAVPSIHGRDVRIEEAVDLWGLDTRETESRLRAEHPGETPGILSIGPAGENGVAFACAMSDYDHAAGRTGLGAVMGSKRLKAIVVRREGLPLRALSGETAGKAVRRYARRIREAAEFRFFQRHGGAGYVTWCNDMGILATRNYRQNRFESVDAIDGRGLHRHVVSTRGCPGCPVRCKADLHFENDRGRGEAFNRPEFESMVNLGAKCGLGDLETVVRLDNLCSGLGMDSISTGTVVGFAMDLFDRRIIDRDETGGLDLSWGNAEAMETLIRRIARRQGLGAILANGVRRAARELGRGADQYAPHVKGLELPGYHPGHIMGTALGYMISARGGDFSNIYASLEYSWPPERAEAELGYRFSPRIDEIHGKAFLVRSAVLVNIAMDCLGLCKVPALSLLRGFDLEAEAELARGLTGLDIQVETLMRVGERVADLERLFNLKRGVGSPEDRLPPMFMARPYGSGEKVEKRYEAMLEEYYGLMGWDEEGRPQEARSASVEDRMDPEEGAPRTTGSDGRLEHGGLGERDEGNGC